MKTISHSILLILLSGCMPTMEKDGTYHSGLCYPQEMSKIGLDTFYAGGACEPSYAIEAANMFCNGQNKNMQLKNIQGDDIIFQCLYSDDPEYTSRPEYRSAPNVVIEDARSTARPASNFDKFDPSTARPVGDREPVDLLKNYPESNE